MYGHGHLSNFVHKECPSGGPLSEFPMRRQNPLLQLLARCVVAGLSSFEWNSNGASSPFKSGRNKKVRPNQGPNRFVRSRRPAAVCAAQIAGSPLALALCGGQPDTDDDVDVAARAAPRRQVS